MRTLVWFRGNELRPRDHLPLHTALPQGEAILDGWELLGKKSFKATLQSLSTTGQQPSPQRNPCGPVVLALLVH
jgi:hypothetical protein